MGRKKLNLTEEERQERILRKKEQMKKVYERQKFLKKRLVENLHPEQLEKLRSRRRIENLNPKQLEKLRTSRRVENLKPEQLEKKRKHDRTYHENIRTKRRKLMVGIFEDGQVEYLDNGHLNEECTKESLLVRSYYSVWIFDKFYQF
ncbi:hypothetical protein TNCV_1168001 [Trichonephila clavipes]|uniref:Uncharacterized protein n=1 Tax=Trichonephila clavipes TaxID=2585209 RepID=A0A8X6T0Z3_TRICX|nr:hypothetical protein TNCV_1168001 [Trichonephila clavipes]